MPKRKQTDMAKEVEDAEHAPETVNAEEEEGKVSRVDTERFLFTAKTARDTEIMKDWVCTKPWSEDVKGVIERITKEEEEDVNGGVDGKMVGYSGRGLERKRDPNWALAMQYQFSGNPKNKFEESGYKAVYWRHVQARQWKVEVKKKGDRLDGYLVVEGEDGREQPVHRIMTPFFAVREAYVGQDGTMGNEVYEERMAKFLVGKLKSDPTKHKLKLVGDMRPVFVPACPPGYDRDGGPSTEEESKYEWLVSRSRNTEMVMFYEWTKEVLLSYYKARLRYMATNRKEKVEDSLQTYINAQLGARNVKGSAFKDATLVDAVASDLLLMNLVPLPFFELKHKSTDDEGKDDCDKVETPGRVAMDVSTNLAYPKPEDVDEPPWRISRDPVLLEKWEKEGLDYQKIILCRNPKAKDTVDAGDIVAAVVKPDFYLDKNTLKFRFRGPMRTVFHSGASLPVVSHAPGATEEDGSTFQWDEAMFPSDAPCIEDAAGACGADANA